MRRIAQDDGFSLMPGKNCQRMTEHLQSLRKQESRGVGCEKEKATTLDPRLLMSRMTEGETSGTSVEDDRRGLGMKIANDNPKLSFLRKQESRVVRRKKQRHWILYLTGSPIKNVGESVEDDNDRRGLGMKMNDNPKLSFLRKQESRVVGCEKEKATTLDPFFDWIPDQVGDRRRGQASRMTEKTRRGSGCRSD